MQPGTTQRCNSTQHKNAPANHAQPRRKPQDDCFLPGSAASALLAACVPCARTTPNAQHQKTPTPRTHLVQHLGLVPLHRVFEQHAAPVRTAPPLHNQFKKRTPPPADAHVTTSFQTFKKPKVHARTAAATHTPPTKAANDQQVKASIGTARWWGAGVGAPPWAHACSSTRVPGPGDALTTHQKSFESALDGKRGARALRHGC